jgi:hypothetical protein
MVHLKVVNRILKRITRVLALVGFASFPFAAPAQAVQDGSFEFFGGNLWSNCMGTPDAQVLDGFGVGIYGVQTPAAAGTRYLGLHADALMAEGVGQPMAMESGIHFMGSVQLFRSQVLQNWDGTGQLELWGGSDCNHAEELLWRSGSVTNVDAWQTFPIEFTPTRNHSFLQVRLVMDAGSGQSTYLCVDDLSLFTGFFGFDFVDFDAEVVGAQVGLAWQTAPLQAVVEFDVQVSNDGNVFASVGQLQGQVGASHFQYSHFPSALGNFSFRIVGTDVGGHQSVSEVRVVQVTDLGTLTFYPNPNRGLLSLRVPIGTYISAFNLYDMAGSLVASIEVSDAASEPLQLPLYLPNGVYVMEVQMGSKTVHQRLLLDR